MGFTLHRLRLSPSEGEFIGIVGFVDTIDEYTAGEPANKRGVRAALLVLRDAELD